MMARHAGRWTALAFLAAFSPTTAWAYRAEVEDVPARRYFEVAEREIDGAKASVDLFMYSFGLRADRGESMPLRLAEALARAKGRGVRVRVVLDQGPDPDDLAGADDARNAPARDYLSAAGVEVLMDDPAVTTHAKALIIDGKTALVGSSNWTTAALSRNAEADVLVRSPELARELLADLGRSVPPGTMPAAPPVLVRWDFASRPDLLGRMATRHDERAFDVYLDLLKEGRGGGSFVLDEDALAQALGLSAMGRDAARRQIHKTLAKLRDDYGLVRFSGGYDRDPRVDVIAFSTGPAAGIPLDYWALGWDRRLPFAGKVFYLLGLRYSAASPDRPRWTAAREALAARHGVSPAFISAGVTALRRAGLVEADYGDLTKDAGPRDATTYTPRALYDPAERDRLFQTLRDKYGPDKLDRARRLAVLVYDDSDAAAVERLILLEEKRGIDRVRRAADIVAAKNPDNPARTMGYLIGIIESLP